MAKAIATPTGGAELELLERASSLVELDDCLGGAAAGAGRLVLVSGEAGIGKTALVERFCAENREARVLWGAADGLHTPRPLGPLLDIAAVTGGPLAEIVERGDRPHVIFATFLEELRSRRPTIAVLEDLHWADEATIDILRLLGRRAEATQALVIATYRDDELDRTHPLRVAVGELGTTEGVRRLELHALSPEAVAELAAPHGVDADDLYRRTAGNPFFVTEVLAAGEANIPTTVRDAVLARASRLSPSARSLLEAVAIMPLRCDLWLLETLVGEEIAQLDEALSLGMLRSEGQAVVFRHELARLAIEESIGPHRRVALHREALRALSDPPGADLDLARLSHHAEAAGDGDAVLEFAPAAAARAASLGAHREAAAQYARALRFAGALPPQQRAQLLDRRAHECFLTDQNDEAVEAIRQALEHHRALGDRRREGESLRALAQSIWCPGRTSEAEQAAREAVTVLETLPRGRELALAYSMLAAVYKDMEDADQALAWGARALELAEQLGDIEIVIHALNTVGTMEFLLGATTGREKLERSVELAREHQLGEQVGRGFIHLTWATLRQRLYGEANRYLDAGLAFCSERGFELFRLYLLGFRARSELDQGRWEEAVDTAAVVSRVPRHSTIPRILSLAVLGRVRARRGDPEAWPPLEEAWALAEPTGELQRIEPAAAARAEAFWLEGRHQEVAVATEGALELAVLRRASWVSGELACWRWRAGVEEAPPEAAAEPYAASIAGDWARAAELWRELGCPYEAALALADADDQDALRHALEELQRLGAAPAAAIVARRLRKRGARGLPRGPRPATRANPAGLTPRELEVLALVAQGLRNAEIADRLVVAEKTVDHHVSAILRKLDVRTRGQASAEAVRLGLAGQDR